MLYVERDKDGIIIGLRYSPDEKATEKKSVLDEEVLEFLDRNSSDTPWIKLLSLSDIGIIRILEDLIDLLIRKNTILLTDLPEQAQNKIRERKQLREKMGNDDIMVDDVL